MDTSNLRIGQKIKIKRMSKLEKIYGTDLREISKTDRTFLKKRAGKIFKVRNIGKKGIYVKNYVGRFFFAGCEIEKVIENIINLNGGLFEL